MVFEVVLPCTHITGPVITNEAPLLVKGLVSNRITLDREIAIQKKHILVVVIAKSSGGI